MRLLRAWVTLVWLSFNRLLWSTGSFMIFLPFLACALLLFRQRYGQTTDLSAGFNRFSHEFLINIFALFLVPICALAYGTSSIGGDREDRTLLFLLVRPIPRPLVLLAKVAATLPLVIGLTLASFYVYCRLAGEVGNMALKAYFPAVFYMAFAYTCVFHLFAVLFRHSTIVALVYSLFMEFILGNLPGIVKRVAVNFYGRSMMYRMGEGEGLQAPPAAWFEPISAGEAEAALVCISIGSLALAMIIFQRREYRDLT